MERGGQRVERWGQRVEGGRWREEGHRVEGGGTEYREMETEGGEGGEEGHRVERWGTGTGTGNIYLSQKQQNRVFNTKTIQYITSMST